jgi:DNA repair photolyase
MIPGLNDHEIPAIVAAVAEAGAQTAFFIPVRLPWTVAPIFENWLEEHFPDRKAKILERIRDLRGGKLNDPNFFSRMRGSGVHAETMRNLFTVAARKAGLDRELSPLSTTAFKVPTDQLDLF